MVQILITLVVVEMAQPHNYRLQTKGMVTPERIAGCPTSPPMDYPPQKLPQPLLLLMTLPLSLLAEFSLPVAPGTPSLRQAQSPFPRQLPKLPRPLCQNVTYLPPLPASQQKRRRGSLGSPRSQQGALWPLAQS